MNDSDRNRLTLLRKRNRLGQILPKMSTRLIQIEPDLANAKIIPIEGIENLVKKQRVDNRETVLIKRAPKSNPKPIYIFLEILADRLNSNNLFSTYELQDYWYAEINTKNLAFEFEKIIEIDGNLFIVHDIKMKNGFWIDMNEENWTTKGKTNYEWIYEMKIWGKEWTSEIFNHFAD